MPLSWAPGMGWSNVGSSTCLYTHQRDSHQHGSQKVKPILLSTLYTLRVNDTNTNIIQGYIDLFVHFGVHSNQTTVTATDHHTRPSFFPPFPFLVGTRSSFEVFTN